MKRSVFLQIPLLASALIANAKNPSKDRANKGYKVEAAKDRFQEELLIMGTVSQSDSLVISWRKSPQIASRGTRCRTWSFLKCDAVWPVTFLNWDERWATLL